jgi:hypothetical protein
MKLFYIITDKRKITKQMEKTTTLNNTLLVCFVVL